MTASGPGTYQYIIDPSRNFNILGSTTIMDPADGREKFVLSNFAAGATGNVIVIDPLTGEGEAIQLPGDNGAWAVLNWRNEKLLVGTCAQSGYLHCLDLKTRTWAEPLRDPHETYIWELTIGFDGLVYGCTYPGCVLLRYDPHEHTLENLGRVSDNPRNLYSRHVDGGVPGYILVSGGMDTHFAAAYHIESGRFFPIGEFAERTAARGSKERYIRLEIGDAVQWYDPLTFLPLDSSSIPDQAAAEHGHPLRDGRIAGVRGQDYYLKKPGEAAMELQRIPTPAPATQIHTLVSDKEGNIWGASAFGQTIFRYNPKDDDLWNSSVVTDRGGEVYGMCFVGDKLFLSAYSGGDHIVYDPSMPWDQIHNVNPRTLESVAPALIRPTGRSVVGPDGGVWTGWSAKYGVYGGGLSRIDVHTLDVTHWYDPVPNQQVAGLCADDRYVYFTTNGGASGLPYHSVPCHFAVWSVEGSIVYQQSFDEALRLDTVFAAGGVVLVRAGNELKIFDPAAMQFVHDFHIGEPCGCMIALDENTVGAFCGDHFYVIDAAQRTMRLQADLPGHVHTAALTPHGDIYFACGIGLYTLKV